MWVYIENTTIQKDICTPTFTAALLNNSKTQTQENVHWQIEAKEDAAHAHNGPWETTTEIMELCPRLPQGWTWKNLTLTKLASQGKTIVYYLPSMQNEKRDAKELIYNTIEKMMGNQILPLTMANITNLWQ